MRGKILFNTALPPLTSRLWIACSSCHPDGHSDGRVWQNPDGKRENDPDVRPGPHASLHWSADRDEVQDFEYTIRGRLMSGRGLLSGPMKAKKGYEFTELDENLAGRSNDLDALAIYCNSFDFSRCRHTSPTRENHGGSGAAAKTLQPGKWAVPSVTAVPALQRFPR